MFICRSLEEFREAYLQIIQQQQQPQPQPAPDDGNVGAMRAEPRDDSDHASLSLS